ncbi:MAG: hypothetical protein AB8B74_08980 [Crocinitomicaceae bacterium]
MKKQFLIYTSISIINLLLLLGVFKLFQNEQVYNSTLGKVSKNYERTGSWNKYKVKKVSKPYVEINHNNLLWWDASIYHCISERMYKKEKDCHGNVRAAFFPLFPSLWKITNSSAFQIVLINYSLYAIGLMLLFFLLSKSTSYDKTIQFALLLTLPTSIIFIIPYTEAMFLFCMAIAAAGIIRNRYYLYFTGALLTAMVRPATIFVLFAILAVELLTACRHRNLKQFLKDSFAKALPFGLGYSLAIIIQYISSGSWTAFSDSHAYWSGGVQKIGAIVDWSIEGFGMNVFAIIVISIPALVFGLYILVSTLTKSFTFLDTIKENKSNYLFLVSAFYITGLLIFTLITSKGNLHSYFRFTLTSPLFYMGVILLLGYIKRTRFRYLFIIYSIALSLMILFLYNVPYGGVRFTFSYLGMYLLIITTAYLIFRKWIPKILDIAMLVVLVSASTVWTTFLFNSYLSNGWIFT